jgi:HEAT repeats/von Willebrand factor type A domain
VAQSSQRAAAFAPTVATHLDCEASREHPEVDVVYISPDDTKASSNRISPTKLFDCEPAMKSLTLLALLFLAPMVTGQDPECTKCGDKHFLPCQIHSSLTEPMQAIDAYLSWGEKVACCEWTGLKACPDCLKKLAKTPESAKADWPPQKRRHRHHLLWDWKNAGGNAIELRSLFDLAAHLGQECLTSSSRNFFLVTNPPEKALTKVEFATIQKEIEDLRRRFPGMPIAQDNQMKREDWSLLWLTRCERLRDRYWSFLGRQDAPDFLVYHVGREAEKLELDPEYRRLEAFVVTPEVARNFETYHKGARRVFKHPERFVCQFNDGTPAFPESDLSSDSQTMSVLAYRIGAALSSQFMMVQNRKKLGYALPFFLENGLAHALAIDATGKSVFSGGSAENIGGAARAGNGDWQPNNWQELMAKLVGKRRKDGASNAPTFAQLVAVKTETADFRHHVAAWSLITFLRLLPDEGQNKFLRFMLEIRNGTDPDAALQAVYNVGGRELTEVWHSWARDNSKSIAAPTGSLHGAGPEAVLSYFRKVWSEKVTERTDKASLEQRRLGAIQELRWAPPGEAANELIKILKNDKEPEEATKALIVIRQPQLAQEAVAKALGAELEKQAARAKDIAFLERLTRAAGSQIAHRDLLLPILHKYMQSVEMPPQVIASVAHSLGELGSAESTACVSAATKSPNALVRAEAAAALARINPEAGFEAARRLINDPSWHVRIASIEIFRNLPSPEAGDCLIARMPLENGRLLEDIENTLIKMLQLKQGFPSSAAWKEFWQTAGREMVTKGAGAAKRPSAGTAVVSDGSDFPPIRSKRFMFLLDVSMSMDQPVSLIPKTTVAGKQFQSMPKISFVIQKLQKILLDSSQVPADVIFNIALFAETTNKWKDALVPAGDTGSDSRNNAVKFLDQNGRAQAARTDLKTALQSALNMAKASLDKGERESAIDTIYLVTDGSPTAGRMTDSGMLCDWFREENRTHKIKIYVISIGATDTDVQFLERLSGENYGPPPVIVTKEN